MNRGDGLRMGMAAGAALGNMSEAWWAPALAVPDERVDGEPFFRMLFQERALPGGLVVDSLGQRFADEASNYNDFGRSLQAFDPGRFDYPRVPSWLVFDAASRASHQYGPLTPETPDPDWLARGDSLEALAARIEVPASALQETIERFNRQAAAGVDEDFGRGSYAWDQATVRRAGEPSSLRPLTEAPFYALQVLPGCLGTKGGLKTNAQGRVLRADGSGAIEGLFAAGNAAANPFGHAYPGAGGTIGPAVVFGWCAGEAAAAG
jgi:succinate dehydrogenase/fumarate reductase flavoprotein subunit